MSLLWNVVRSIFFRRSVPILDPDSYLRADNPRLLELEQRYANLQVAMADSSLWSKHYIAAEVELRALAVSLPTCGSAAMATMRRASG